MKQLELVQERPPVYEFCMIKIFICLFFGCVLTALTLFACTIFCSHEPLLALLGSQFVLFFYFLCKTLNSMWCDIPSQFYHPDLLPNTEYKYLSNKLFEARKEAGRILYYHRVSMSNEMEKKYKDYQKTINELTPIINAQNELRLLCSFKKTFGYIITPAIFKESETPVSMENVITKKSDVKVKSEEGKTCKNEEISDNDELIFNESNTSDKSPSEDSAFEFNCDKFYDFNQLPPFFGNSRPEFKSELSLDQGCQIPGKSKKSGNFPLISREFPFHNLGFDKKATNMGKIFQKLENLESIFLEKIDQKNNLRTNDTAKIMKKLEILENLEIEFAEMKAENKAIKESVQQILESQLPF